MRATVDKETCIGCELCVSICPDVFEMADGVAVAKVTTVPPEAESTCRESAESCPVTAISLA